MSAHQLKLSFDKTEQLFFSEQLSLVQSRLILCGFPSSHCLTLDHQLFFTANTPILIILNKIRMINLFPLRFWGRSHHLESRLHSSQHPCHVSRDKDSKYFRHKVSRDKVSSGATGGCSSVLKSEVMRLSLPPVAP